MTIIVVNDSGLGNRIKNIVSAIRKGHRIGDTVDIRCEHKNLFQVAQCVDKPHASNFEIMSTWGLLMLPEESERKILRVPRTVIEYHDRGQFGPLPKSIDFQYSNIENDVVDEFRRYFSLILFRPEILLRVEELSADWEIQDKVGVHIRTWYDSPDRCSTLYRIEDFFKILDDLAETERFFLCVDHPSARDSIFGRYGSQRVLEPVGREIGHLSVDRRDQVAFDSMVDMLLLSRCKELVGTYQSTFTECAWWFGGCTQTVQIPVPAAILEIEGACLSPGFR